MCNQAQGTGQRRGITMGRRCKLLLTLSIFALPVVFGAETPQLQNGHPLDYWMNRLQDSSNNAMLIRAEASVVVAKFQGKAVPGLLDLLKSERSEIREISIQALGKIGLEASGSLATVKEMYKSDKAPSVRASAAHALTKITKEKSEAVALLVCGLADASPIVVNAVVQAIGKCGKDARPAIGPLLKLIDPIDPDRSAMTIVVLDTIRLIGVDGTEATPILLNLLSKAKNGQVKVGIIQALISIGASGDDTIDALSKLQKDDDSLVRGAAAMGLELLRRKSQKTQP